MIHIGALPGAPRSRDPIDVLIESALLEARQYAAAGVDAIMIENMHDAPYLAERVGPEIVAGMTAIGRAVRETIRDRPLGIQILAGANMEALAVALATRAEFVRVENFAFAHVADEGLMPRAAAGPLLRYRRAIDGGAIAIWADIKKKHASHALTADISIAETAKAAAFCGADGLIITGASTGEPASPPDLVAVRGVSPLPLIVGSGVTVDNLATYWDAADGFIVGSYFKRDGHWMQPLETQRIERFMAHVRELRR